MLFLEQKLKERELGGNLRVLSLENDLVDFASNDYLGMAKRLSIECSGGMTGSRLLTGNTGAIEALEHKIATYHGKEAALIFNCGYMANIGLLSSIAAEGDTLLYDTEVHASMHDGFKLSKAACYPFRHQDLEHLEKRLKQAQGNCFVCICSVYSMSGDSAPTEAIEQLCARYQAHLIVDEAHAVGILGEQGRGLSKKAWAQIITFGKGVGIYGAAILGSGLLRHFLINFSRSFIYSTALPPSIYASIDKAYDLLPKMDAEREHLQLLASYFDSQSHIQIHPVAGNHQAKQLSYQLMQAGFDVRSILSPTVKKGGERLRICLHAYNTPEQVEALCALLS
ncbi:MAG: pyridoxal phosphate-dependent aminotransferase family protein [Chlamydiia bacterium]|nr:pyridoxal phosphate-dependent aminotransferase family protein [Chlamydiia bacterium]